MNNADTIFASWDEKAKKSLKGAPEMTLDAALAVLKDAPDGANARTLMGLYMGVLKNTEDAGDLGQLRTAMQDQYGKTLGLDAHWFKGMAQAVKRLRQQAKKGLGDVGHITHVDVSLPYDQLVQRTASGIKFRNKDKPTLFRTVAGVSRIRRLPEANVVVIEQLNRDSFTSEMEASLSFYSENKDGDRVSVAAPKELARHIHSRSDVLEIPYLSRLVSSPVYGRNGLICDAGYHASEHLFYEPAQGLSVPEVPKKITDEHRKEALRLIAEEWLGDYPFDGWTREELVAAALGGDPKNPPPASFLNFVGAALEQLVRPIIKGSLPMTLIDKPSPRTGASMLAGQLQILTDGSSAMQTFTKKEEEVEKRIMGSLLGGKNRLTYDNVTGLVNSPALAMLLTSATFTGRVLQKTGDVEAPVRLSITMTGNNPSFTKELAERINKVRLDARMERPGTRTGFRHADLDAWVEKNRGQLVWALLVLVRNWQQKGKPGPVKPVAWGAYQSYVAVIGGILGAAAENWTTWQDNREALVEDSDEDDPIKQMLAAWWSDKEYPRRMPVNAKKGPCLTAMLAVEEIELPVRTNGGQPYAYQTVSLGKFLGQSADRVFNIGVHLGQDAPFNVEIEKGKAGNNGTVWIIKEAKAQRVDGPAAGNVVKVPFGGTAAAANVAADAAEPEVPVKASTVETAPAEPVKQMEATQEAAPALVRTFTDPVTGETFTGNRAILARRRAAKRASS